MPEPNEVEAATLEEVPRKKKKSKLLLLVAALLVLGLGGGGAFFFYNQGTAAKAKKKKPAKKEDADPSANEQDGTQDGTDEPEGNASSIIALEPFIANLADQNEARYIRITLSLGITAENKDEGKEAAKDVLVISKLRDAILAVLISKTSGELLSEDGKRKLRRQLLDAVRARVKKPRITEVYITDLVVQM